MKVMTIVGTRPEIIRLSCTIISLDESEAIEHILVHTGQNYDYELNEIFFDDLGLRKPDYFLDAAGKNATETVNGTDKDGNSIKSRQYIEGVDASNKLLKYASLTGAYKSNWKRTTPHMTAGSQNTPFEGSLFVDKNSTYEKNPLICNEIYPGLLNDLEEEEGDDKLKCELAKTCGISWSKLNCD